MMVRSGIGKSIRNPKSEIRNRRGCAWAALVSAVLASAPAAAQEADASRLPRLVTPQISKAISRGLDYLAKTQQPDGSLPANYGGRSYPAAMTALGGLAFLSSGSTPTHGTYAENIRRAMVYLMQLGDAHPDGLIAGKVEARCTYGHGFSMTFLALCYGMEPSEEYEQRLKHTLDRAIRLVANGQSDKGGWLYSPVGKGGDEGSTTSCVLQGLRACRNAGLKVPTETIDRAVGYLVHCQNPDGGIAYSAISRGTSRLGISTAAIACYYAAGVYDRKAGGNGTQSRFVDRLWQYVDENVKDTSNEREFQVYTSFYLAQGKYQRGGENWDAFYRKISKDLLAGQRANGSWPGEDVGPVYGTSVALVILQLPYGHLPLCER
jgi:hypothetical protein